MAGARPAGSALGCLGLLLQGSEVFEGRSAVVAGQVLVELLLEGLQAVAVGGAGTEAGDVRAWGVWQVDGEGLWQHQELILLRRWGGREVIACAGGRSALGVGSRLIQWPLRAKARAKGQPVGVLKKVGLVTAPRTGAASLT